MKWGQFSKIGSEKLGKDHAMEHLLHAKGLDLDAGDQWFSHLRFMDIISYDY